MKLHRIIILICVLLGATAAALPLPAQASSLLSGYGGPGQGSQAILGSALLNGPKGGAGSGGSGSSAPASGAQGSARIPAAPVVEGSSSGSHPSAPAGKGASGTRGSTSRGAARSATGSAATTAARQRGFYPVAESVPSGDGGGTLGLTGADLIYIILAVGVLVSLGVLTRRVGVDPREGSSG